MTMKRLGMTTAAIVLIFGSSSPAQSRSPAVEERLQRLFDPLRGIDLRGYAEPPTNRVGSARVESPELPLPRADVAVPVSTIPSARPIRPRFAVEPPALTSWIGNMPPPRRTTLPEGILIAQVSVDLQKAPPLPTLGHYVKDRVSLADPSWDISGAIILAPQSPERVNPVPFVPWNLPDPFQNSTVIRLRQPWTENPDPPRFVVPPTKR